MCTPSTILCLVDYTKETRWLVASNGFTLSPPQAISPDESGPRQTSGFISFRRLGFIKRYKTVVAIFRDGEALKFAVKGRIFDLMEGSAKAYKRTLLPFLTSFTLKQKDKVVFRCVYWFDERDDCWPENDIFSYVERATESEESKRASRATICGEIQPAHGLTMKG